MCVRHWVNFFFWGLSLALKSYNQFQASHWSFPPPKKKTHIFLPSPLICFKTVKKILPLILVWPPSKKIVDRQQQQKNLDSNKKSFFGTPPKNILDPLQKKIFIWLAEKKEKKKIGPPPRKRKKYVLSKLDLLDKDHQLSPHYPKYLTCKFECKCKYLAKMWCQAMADFDGQKQV